MDDVPQANTDADNRINQAEPRSDFEGRMLDTFRRLNASEELRREIARHIS